MKRTMRGLLHLTERNKTNVVRLAHFFKRPANAHITRQSPAAIRRPFKGGDGGGHGKAPADCMTPPCVSQRVLTLERLRPVHVQHDGVERGRAADVEAVALPAPA